MFKVEGENKLKINLSSLNSKKKKKNTTLVLKINKYVKLFQRKKDLKTRIQEDIKEDKNITNIFLYSCIHNVHYYE